MTVDSIAVALLDFSRARSAFSCVHRDMEHSHASNLVGALTFGLVNIPVRLHSAVQAKERVSFRLLHKTDLVADSVRARVREGRRGRGLERDRQRIRVREGQVRRPHRRRLQGRGDRIVEDDRDPGFRERRRDRPALLRDAVLSVVPAKGGEKAYALLREAIKRTGMVGIGKITMRTNSLHLAGIKTVGDAIVLEIMRFADELVDVGRLHVPERRRTFGRRSCRWPSSSSRTWREPFDPSKYTDDYRANLMKIIRAKMKGKKIEVGEARRAREHAGRRPDGSPAGEPRASGNEGAQHRLARQKSRGTTHAGQTRVASQDGMKTFSPMLATRRHAKFPTAATGSSNRSTTAFASSRRADGKRRRAGHVGTGSTRRASFPRSSTRFARCVAAREAPFVVDGEIVATARDEPARFQELQGRMHVDQRSGDRRRIAPTTPAALMVFDMLLDGKKTLVDEPWRVRRKRLDGAAVAARPDRRAAPQRVERRWRGDAARGATHGWEGIMAKRSRRAVRAGRADARWLKLKIERRQEFVVGGWTEPRNSREHFGALLLGYYDDDGDARSTRDTPAPGSRARRCSTCTERSSASSARHRRSPRRRARTSAAHWVRAGDRRRDQVQRVDDRREAASARVHRRSRRQDRRRMSCANRNRRAEIRVGTRSRAETARRAESLRPRSSRAARRKRAVPCRDVSTHDASVSRISSMRSKTTADRARSNSDGALEVIEPRQGLLSRRRSTRRAT